MPADVAPALPSSADVSKTTSSSPPALEYAWYVAHTKPRCEKKFAALMDAEHWNRELFFITSERRYGNRRRVYAKPVFPGYVFICIPPAQKSRCYQQELLVRLIEVDDEALLLRQLEDVRRLLASGNEMILYPLLKRGARARIKSGPLRGIQGIIDNPANPSGIVLSVDVLQQGVLVKIAIEDLEIEP
ncbi:antitermination protein NusG [Opitutaceae bacterium TAV4]|nr:antitermination protein NusG [Opitutaceae bacterium TAV4]